MIRNDDEFSYDIICKTKHFHLQIIIHRSTKEYGLFILNTTNGQAIQHRFTNLKEALWHLMVFDKAQRTILKE